jgi:D,D-heptose 1,7-bisphosphate phosphatase
VGRAIFFDRDGTLIVDRHYLGRPEGVELRPGAADALREAAELGFDAVVVSNQSGVARGYFDEAAVQAVNRRMIDLLGRAPRAVYCCFHHPQGLRPEYAIDCDCRKPKPGLLLRAERELGVSLRDSFLIGDSLRDVGAAKAAGVKAVLLLDGESSEYVKAFGVPAEVDHAAPDLAAAMAWVRSAAR